MLTSSATQEPLPSRRRVGGSRWAARAADVQAGALAALQSVALDPIVAETGFANPWLLFDSYFDELTAACEAQVVPKWTDRLAGADVFTADHCYRIIESLRID